MSAAVSSQERTILHFWNSYDFADTTLIHKPEISEQMFANFVVALSQTDDNWRDAAVDTLLARSLSGGMWMFDYFAGLSEKYLYDPNSPCRNEDIYITVLQKIIANEKLDDIYKVRPRYQLDMALRNRVGNKATDFEYTTPKGGKYTLYATKGDPLLLFFQVPDCPTCKKVKAYVKDKGIDKRVKILYVNPDTDTHLNTFYDLRASPTLYLLDKDKRVIFKDAPIEQIEQYMTDK